MSSLPIIEHGAEQALVWIHELRDTLQLKQDRSAYAALRAVLHALRERLPLKESADLAAQMPTFIRGVYFEGWSPKEGAKPVRSTEAFTQQVMDMLKGHDEIHAQKAIRAVFAMLDDKISHGEMNDVIGNFSVEMRQLWPEAAVARLGANKM